MRRMFLIVPLVLLLECGPAEAAFKLRPITAGYKNEIGLGVSYGIKLDNDASFAGFAPDYLRVLSDKWMLNVSLAYDEETQFKNGVRSVTESWTPSVMIGYQVNTQLAVGAGLGHGLRTNENGAGWKSVELGKDLSAAAAVAVSLWQRGRHGLSLSVSLEYNISDSEASVSTDIGYGWSF